MDGNSWSGDTTQSCREKTPAEQRTLSSGHLSPAMESETRTDVEGERSTSTILVVDDEESIRDLVRAKLTREGRQVLLAARGQEAVEVFRRHRPDITILDLDLHMPGMNGIEVLKQIRAVDSQAVVMIFTGADTAVSAKEDREARELGVTEFLQKGHALPAV